MSVKETKKHEQAREKNRKKTSVVRGSVHNSNTNSGREKQRRTSVGEGNLNNGSNRNMGRKHESEDAPVHEPQGGFRYTPDQTERRHEGVDSDSKAGGRKPREVKESSVAERHVQGEPGFTEAERRHSSVAANRKETERTFDSRRKR